MQRKSNHIKLYKQHQFSIKAVIRYCWMAILAISFFYQQFSAFAALISSTKEKRFEFHLLHSNSAHFSSHLPSESAPIAQEWEMEVPEEDETKSNLDEYFRQSVQNHLSEELLYSSSLLSRFLQLTTSLHNRTTVPCFILHHSWKSELS